MNNLSGYAALGGPFGKVVHDHRFVGGNTVVTTALDGKKTANYLDAVKRVQSVASLALEIVPGKNNNYGLRVKVSQKI